MTKPRLKKEPKEHPVRVIRGRSRAHRTESRIFRRDIWETYCVHPGCKFRGQIAQQGVCHTTKPFVPGASWEYIDRVEKEAERDLADLRKTWRRKRDYLSQLESLYVCGQMSAIFMLDELVRLRRRVALAEAKSARRGRSNGVCGRKT